MKPVTAAQIRRAMQAATQAGLYVREVILRPGGEVAVVIGRQGVESDDDNDAERIEARMRRAFGED